MFFRIFPTAIVLLFFLFIFSANAEQSDITFNVGGEERLRGDVRNNFDFNDQIDDKGNLVFQRLLPEI